MKRKLLLSLLGVAVSLSTTPAYAAGGIYLDNYSSTLNPLVTYGSGWGALSGSGLLNGTPDGINWTVSFYYAIGDVRGSVSPDPEGLTEPSFLGGGLTLATGPGSTASIEDTFAGPGFFLASSSATIGQGWTSGPITIEMVAYSGSTFADSFYRGHSEPFIMTPSALPNPPPSIGDFMPTFGINIPEPSAFALTGVAIAAGLVFRSRRSG